MALEKSDESNLPGVPDGLDSIDIIAAALRFDSADMASFSNALAVRLETLFPGNCRVVRRKIKRFSKTSEVSLISVTLGDDEFTLDLATGNKVPVATRAKRIKGIVLKREDLDLSTWVTELTSGLAQEAARTGKSREAVAKLLGVF